MPQAYIGFYWTLPVNWTGFRRLPENAEDAAAASRTIRYQRERVRRYVRENKGVLLDEISFIDVQPDRATDMVRLQLWMKAAPHAGRATLLYVRFDETSHWRRNPHLLRAASDFGLDALALPPDAIRIDGEMFDPILHFKQWRNQDRSARTRRTLEAQRGLRQALSQVPEGNGRWQAIAERLNREGVRTVGGRRWTAETVRKHASRLQGNAGAPAPGCGLARTRWIVRAMARTVAAP